TVHRDRESAGAHRVGDARELIRIRDAHRLVLARGGGGVRVRRVADVAAGDRVRAGREVREGGGGRGGAGLVGGGRARDEDAGIETGRRARDRDGERARGLRVRHCGGGGSRAERDVDVLARGGGRVARAARVDDVRGDRVLAGCQVSEGGRSGD